MNPTRRTFLTAAAAAPLAAALTAAKASAAAKPPVCIFSKHLQFLDYQQLAKTCREINMDGVDLTVRAKGHVLPENVKRDLPAAFEAVRAEGVSMPMITTRLDDGDDPAARPILETASKLGIKYFRAGGSAKYDLSKPPLPQLEAVEAGFARLAGVAAEYGMTAGYHNHSGPGYIGGPIWDLYYLIRKVDSAHFGSNLDAGHITAEGRAGAWQVNTRLIAPYVKMMAVKDFVHGETGKPAWVPLGEGMVDTTAILGVMREHDFSGPISIHIEYKLASEDAMIEEVRKTGITLRKHIAEAGYV